MEDTKELPSVEELFEQEEWDYHALTISKTLHVCLHYPQDDWSCIQYKPLRELLASEKTSPSDLGVKNKYGRSVLELRFKHPVGLMYIVTKTQGFEIVSLCQWKLTTYQHPIFPRVVSLESAHTLPKTTYRSYQLSMTPCQTLIALCLYWFIELAEFSLMTVFNAASKKGCACYVGAAQRNGLRTFYKTDIEIDADVINLHSLKELTELTDCNVTYAQEEPFILYMMPVYTWKRLKLSSKG